MSYFTIKRNFFLVPQTNIDEEYEKIDKFMKLLEKSGVAKIIKSVKSEKKICKVNQGNPGYNPYNLFAAIIYCFSKFKASLRDIDDKCKFDIRVIYIMEGKVPDYSTICKFINDYFLPYQYEIFAMINKQIIKELNLDISDAFVDGTKLEANSNKYKFVWKPTKFHRKLDEKIKAYLNELGYAKTIRNDLIKSNELKNIIDAYVETNNIDINNIPIGRGKRLTVKQKYYKIGYQYLLKLLDYEEKEEICGENRNSYFKTDYDATAMVLKEDYYSKLSHDFHAGYNFQALISSGLIMMYGIFQDRSDYYTLIPLLNLYKKHYGSYPKNLCADSGYGIYINYLFLMENKIVNYIKFQNWKGESNGKKPQLFYTFGDGVMCLNTCIGEEVPFDKNHHQRYKDGKLFKFTGCNNCNYAYKCKEKLKHKEYDYRFIELIPRYELLKEQARNNLLSPKGIEMRINRSIQSEGTFGQIKYNMNYDRIRRRGLEKVGCEVMLECLGANIRRYINSIKDENKFKNSYWNQPDTLHHEKFPNVKQKKKV